MIELRSKKLVPFLMSLFFAFLVFSPFLGEHWVHDSYMISRHGYNYTASGLYNQGRVFSSGLLHFLDAVHAPYGITMTLSVGLSLIFLCLAAFSVYRMTLKYTDIKEAPPARYFAAVLASVGIFLNLFVADTFLFYENAVMSLGALLAALSARFFLRDGWRDYMWSLLLLIAAVFCYQADIAYFPPIVILFICAGKERFEPKLRKFLLAVVFCMAAMLLNYAFLRITASDDTRVAGALNISENLKQCYLAFRDFLADTLDFTPKYVYLGFGMCFGVLFIYDAIRRRSIRQLIPVILAGAALVICSLFVHIPMSYFYVMPRSAVALAGLVPIAALGAAMYTKRGKKALLILCLIFTLFVAGQQIDMQKNNYAANKLDDMELTLIADLVSNYENETGNRIEKLFFASDPHPQYHRKNITSYKDVTIRILAVPWVVHSRLEAYLDRPLKWDDMSDDDRERLFGDKDWDRFNPEQLVFEEDTMYLCNY